MAFPIEPHVFKDNPFQPEWMETDYIFTPEGPAERPKHVCKTTFELSKPFIKHHRTAIDIGCRMGEYSRFLQPNFDRLFAFDARVHPLFSSNLSLEHVTAFDCALGDSVGEISMSGGGHAQVEGRMRSVPVFRLDDFGLTDVDYIKIDVEGFERRVILGGWETITRDRPLIVIEQNDVRLPDEEPYAAKTLLESIGYRHVATCKRGWDHVMSPD